MSTEQSPSRFGQFEWQQVPWSATPVMTRGSWGGLPALGWGWVDRSVLATRRQLTEQGLRPGGQPPAAVLVFGHRERHRHWRRADHAYLYQVEKAKPKRPPSEAQRAAIQRALAARRTCTECGAEQDYYLSTISRQCAGCEDATDFWGRYYEQRFGPDHPTNHTTSQDTSQDTARNTCQAPGREPERAAERCAAAIATARHAVARLHQLDRPDQRVTRPPAAADEACTDLTSTDRPIAVEEVA